MDEEKIIIPTSEVEVIGDIDLYEQETVVSETYKEVGVETSEAMTIDVAEVTGVVVGDGESSNHTHQVTSINTPDGTLEDTLNILASPHEVYSQYGGYAEFRQWTTDDKSYYQKNIANSIDPSATGYFVGLVNENNNPLTAGNICIDICHDGVVDVYGVVASKSSAFCGYQYPEYNLLTPTEKLDDGTTVPLKDKSDSNEPYAKVCLLGDVAVRVYNTENFKSIAIGDFVVPDEYGCAKKSNVGIGYKVISKGQAGTNTSEYRWYYVVITLVPQNDNVSRVMAELESTRQNIGNMSITIGKLEENVGNISGLPEAFDKLEGEFGGLQDSVNQQLSDAQQAIDNANMIAQEVKSEAQEAIERMQTHYTEALGAARDAQAEVGNALTAISEIRDDIDILVKHDDTIVGFFTDADSNGATLSTLVENTKNITAIQQQVNDDGGSIRLLVAHADEYSVGPYSLTYGLSDKEAQNVLKDGEFIYISTTSHIEKSYIYQCVLTEAYAKGTIYCKIGDMIYGLNSNNELDIGSILIYDSRMKKLTINDEDVMITPASVETYSLEFESERTFAFEQYGVYKWEPIDSYNTSYWWVKQNKNIISYDDKVPNHTEEGTDLWYCGKGILDENFNYEYTPGTLYHWNGTRWIAVATVNDNNARSTSLFNLTAEYMASTITDIDGSISEIRQTANEISSQVTDVDNQLSIIKQNKESIIAGTYNGEGKAAELAVLLSGISSTVSNTSNVLVGKFFGEPSNASAIKNFYSVPPTWSGTQFEYKEDIMPDDNGEYCLNPNNPEQYYKLGDGEYEVYIMGFQTIASLQQKVDNNSSAIESWTKWKNDTDTTMTAIQQKSDANGAQITSMASTHNVTRVGSSYANSLPSGTYYGSRPSWNENSHTFIGSNQDSNGKYVIPTSDPTCYYEITLWPPAGVEYDIYRHISTAFLSIQGITNDHTSQITTLVSNQQSLMGSYNTMIDSIAYIQQQANDNAASISAVVTNGKANASLIVDAINNNSSVKIIADRINLTGYVTVSSLSGEGTTTINGSNITTGVIKSDNCMVFNNESSYCVKDTPRLDMNKMVFDGSSVEEWYRYGIVNSVSYELISTVDSQIYYYAPWVESGYPFNKINTKILTGYQGFILSKHPFNLVSTLIGMQLDLTNGIIRTPSLIMDTNGSLSMSGMIHATSGYIGNGWDGFTIDYNAESSTYYLGNNQTTLAGDNSGVNGVYMGKDGLGAGNGYWSVDSYGVMNFGNMAHMQRIKYEYEDDGDTLTMNGASISLINGKIFALANWAPEENAHEFSMMYTKIKYNYTKGYFEGRFDFWAPINTNGWTISSTSDARLKTNILDVDMNAVGLLNQIELKSFDWIEDGRHENIGIIAQQLEKVLPDLVVTNENTGIKSVSYMGLISYLVKAIQELSAMVNPPVQTLSLMEEDENETHWVDDMTEEEKQYYVGLSKPPKVSGRVENNNME